MVVLMMISLYQSRIELGVNMSVPCIIEAFVCSMDEEVERYQHDHAWMD